MAAALAAGLTACSNQDNARAHEEAERAKQDLKRGAQQTAEGLRKAGNAVDRGATELKRKVDRDLNTPSNPPPPAQSR